MVNKLFYSEFVALEGAILYSALYRKPETTQKKFSKDFIAPIGEFSRTLTFEEQNGLKSPFPNADISLMRSLNINIQAKKE